jgi:hypothetical protein
VRAAGVCGGLAFARLTPVALCQPLGIYRAHEPRAEPAYAPAGPSVRDVQIGS